MPRTSRNSLISVAMIAAFAGALSIEPYTPAEQQATAEQVADVLGECDVFSPNEDEAASMVGQADTPEELVARLLRLSPSGGADIVVLRYWKGTADPACMDSGCLITKATSPCATRRGAEGVLVARRSASGVEAFRVPAVADTCVADVTGCGNAFNGGFLAGAFRGAPPPGPQSQPELVGPAPTEEPAGTPAHTASAAGLASTSCPLWLRSADLSHAAAVGCVSAAFMAEARGVPQAPIPQLQVSGSHGLCGLMSAARCEPGSTLSCRCFRP